MKKFMVIFFCLGLTLNLSAKIYDKVLVKVNDKMATLKDLEKFALLLRSTNPNSRTASKEQLQKNLMNILILENFMAEKSLSITEKDITREIYSIADRLKLNSPNQVYDMIKNKSGSLIKKDDFRDFIKKQLTIKKAQEYVILREKRSEIQEPSEAAIRNFYQKYKKNFTAPLSVKLAHLVKLIPKSAGFRELMNIENKMNEISSKLNGIKDLKKREAAFYDMVKKEASPVYRSKNGVIGFFNGQKLQSLFPQYLRVARLKQGQISKMIPTEQSRAIVMVLEKRGGQPSPLALVKGKIRQLLMFQQGKAVFTKWIQEYAKNYKIELY